MLVPSLIYNELKVVASYFPLKERIKCHVKNNTDFLWKDIVVCRSLSINYNMSGLTF